MDQLTVNTDDLDETSARLHVSGEIDSASCGVLDSALFDAVASGRPQLDIDMSAVEFMDSSGIRVLVRQAEQIRAIGGRLTISAMSRPVEQVLQLTGLLSAFTEG